MSFHFVLVLYKLQALEMIGKASKLFHLVRIMGIIRIFKVIRHLASLQSLLSALRQANRELGLLALVSGMALVVISTMIYYTERDAGVGITFMDAFWYSLMTLTTVGLVKQKRFEFPDILNFSHLGKL
jgi:hypothetical protein